MTLGSQNPIRFTLLLCVLVLLPLVAAEAAKPLVLHVSPNGNDAWTGRLREPNPGRTDGPLASLPGARECPITHAAEPKASEVEAPMGGAGGLERRLERAVRYAARVGKNKWVGEWQIPLAILGVDPYKMDEWRFNIGVHRAAGETWAAWTDTGGTSWKLEHAGLLVPERAKETGPRRQRGRRRR